MSLSKSTKLDKVEFVEDSKVLQVRERVDVIENDIIISSSYSRYVYSVQPIEDLPINLQPYVTGVWTQEMIDEAVANQQSDAQEALDAEAENQTE